MQFNIPDNNLKIR